MNTQVSNYPKLLKNISSLIEEGRKTAVRNINSALVATYWLMGKRIVEYEQKGAKKAGYGDELLERLADDLTHKYERGFSYSNLKSMRQFYMYYPIRQTLSGESQIGQTLSGLFQYKSRRSLVGFLSNLSQQFRLSWSHYRLLLCLDQSHKREFYEVECLRGSWSVRQLDRQIQSMLYERTALSKQKLSVIAKAHQKPVVLSPEDEIKDPYVLEFLGLKDEYSESELEEALIRHLEHFLLEMGVGFTFVARQKRIMLGTKHYRIDLLLYHRILRCLVIIDVKIGEFNHTDAGQMNFYLNWAKDKAKFPGENNPVGIVLCSGKDKAFVKYALGGMDNKIFVSRFGLKLPKPEVLERELERGRALFLDQKNC